MKARATFDAVRFGDAVQAELSARGMTQAAFIAANPWANKRLVSFVVNHKTVSAAHVLAFCAALGLDPFKWLSVQYQEVTPHVSRVTSSASRAEGAPAGRRKSGDGRSALRASPEGIGAILEGLR